jgi:hypothetical protein
MEEIYIQKMALTEQDNDIVLDYNDDDGMLSNEQYELLMYICDYRSDIYREINRIY